MSDSTNRLIAFTNHSILVHMHRIAKICSIILLALTGVILIPLQMHMIGWSLYVLGLVTLLFCTKQFRKDIALIYLSLGLLGLTPITTDISLVHIAHMGLLLGLAVLLPYCISRFVYKDHLVRFPWHHGRSWYKTEISYILLTAAVAYLLLPFMLRTTGSYQYWTVEPGTWNLFLLFLGTNGLGIWDELFFVCTVLGILRRHLPFRWANLTQAILFTSFLYELGFRGWAFLVIFAFALLQGYIFKKTESLFYVITIHLTLDFILYLVLIHAYHPEWLPIFLIK